MKANVLLQLPATSRCNSRWRWGHTPNMSVYTHTQPPPPPRSCLLLQRLMQKITLSPPTLNCGNCFLQISTKLHLGCSCGWHLQPVWTLITPDLGFSLHQNYGPPESRTVRQTPHTWAGKPWLGECLNSCFETHRASQLRVNSTALSAQWEKISSAGCARSQANPGQPPWATWCLVPAFFFFFMHEKKEILFAVLFAGF